MRGRGCLCGGMGGIVSIEAVGDVGFWSFGRKPMGLFGLWD